MNIVFCCLSITTGIYGMLPLQDSHVPRKGVLTLKEIISNALAQEKAHSYLSRPTCSELSTTNDVLENIPEDLLPEVTSTESKNISLAHLNLHKDITGLVVSSDPNKLVMTSPDGSLIAIDVITKEIHQKKISFKPIRRIHLNDESSDESTESASSSEKFIFSHGDSS
ncbi:MAG TPA: hypothetical protein VJ201_08570, partial [Candidatus Babeliales bacterium]|nr:hypothetical protein [Candidatus Babeliales bacterium]